MCKHLIIVLDCSASMACQASDVIKGVNNIIKQKTTKISLIIFNTEVKLVIDSKANCPELTAENYQPAGYTALYDAIGFAFDKYGGDNDVFMVIITDGEENASEKFTFAMIKEKIANFTELGWTFYYLCEEVAEQGIHMGISSTNSQCVESIATSLNDTHNDLNATLKEWSQNGVKKRKTNI